MFPVSSVRKKFKHNCTVFSEALKSVFKFQLNLKIMLHIRLFCQKLSFLKVLEQLVV